MGGLLVDLNEMFVVKLFVEVELFAKHHPFVEVHLIAFFEKFTEKTTLTVRLLAETVKCHLQVFVVEQV